MPSGGAVFLLLAELLIAELLINLFLFFHMYLTAREGASSYWQKLCHLVWLIRESLAVETSASWHQTDTTGTFSQNADKIWMWHPCIYKVKKRKFVSISIANLGDFF